MASSALALKPQSTDSEHPNALAADTMLNEYRLDRVLGAGGFGITYLAWDTHLEKQVAIKEYLPSQLAVRALDGSVVPIAMEQKYDYAWGLDRFVMEARTLARFAHPHIVRVNRYIQMNGTAYMVMDYEAGFALSQWLSERAHVQESELRRLLGPVLDGLEAVHAQGFLHRDIKPANIYVRTSGAPVLIDFGAARQAIGHYSKSLTSIVSPGYAPLEQYETSGNQGPWTDIYSLGAVMFRAVTGVNPPDAIARLRADLVQSRLGACASRYSAQFLDAIRIAMAMDETARPQTIREWRAVLAIERAAGAVPCAASVDAAPTMIDSQARPAADLPAAKPAASIETRRPRPQVHAGGRRWGMLGVAAIAAVIAAAIIVHKGAPSRQPSATDQAARVAPQHAVATSARNFDNTPHKADPVRARPADSDPRVSRPQAARASDLPAQQLPKPKPMPLLPAMLERELAAVDIDGDGMISVSEARERMPRLAQDFAWADANGDGRISLHEFQRYRRASR